MAQNAWAIVVPLWLFVVISFLPAALMILHAFVKRVTRGKRGRGFEVTGGPATA